jgi:phosphopantetheine adenylyltransferase
VAISIEKENRESIIAAIENEEEKHMFTSVEEKYTLFEQMVAEVTKIIEEKYRNFSKKF